MKYGQMQREFMKAEYRAQTERRKKWIRRLWWHYSEEAGFLLWMVIVFVLCTAAWFLYGLAPR